MNSTVQMTMAQPVPDRRPRETDPWVQKRTASDLAARLIGELPEDFEGFNAADLEEDLRTVVGSPWLDGYEMGRLLEKSCHWTVNLAIVHVLEYASTIRNRHMEAAVRLWVQETGRRLELPIGARVRVPHFDHKTFERSMVEGEVCKLDPERCRYYVFCPSLGHIREEELTGPDGKGSGKSGTLSLLIDAEDVEALDPIIHTPARQDGGAGLSTEDEMSEQINTEDPISTEVPPVSLDEAIAAGDGDAPAAAGDGEAAEPA